jgi:hypoxanthine-guanine phosphoribosyltransferase
MNDRIEKYVEGLLKQKVEVDEDVYSDKAEPNLNKENIGLFVDFIDAIYKDKNVAVFMFPFLEKIDDYIAAPENIDMIKDMFIRIHEQLQDEFDLVTSGGFGQWIYSLVESGRIKFKGNIVVVSGSIRKVKEDEGNPIVILRQINKNIKNKSFIFLDDSYYSGGTRDKINDFLKQFGSDIYKTFVFYTHKKEDSGDVYTTYCFSDYHDENIMPINKYLEYISSVNLKDYEDIIWPAIRRGQLVCLKDLLRMIKRLYDSEKEGEKFFLKENLMLKYTEFIR